MGNKGNKKRCTPEFCGVQVQIDRAFIKFEEIATKLAENQVELRLSLAKLTESVGQMERVYERIEKVEEMVQKNTAMVYKIMGVGLAAAIALPPLISKFF